MSRRVPRLLLAALAVSVMGLAAFIATTTERSPSKPVKRVYIALDDHTDYMWTANEETYRKAFLEMIDFYLDQAEATANLPAHQQSRFNCDGSFWMWVYEKNKSAKDFERFIKQIKSGHMTVPLTGLVTCYGGMPAEAILRSMYYAGAIERRHNVRFPLALEMENQTMPYGLGALFAGSGAKYCWHGICDCASPLAGGHFNDREHPLYWWTGPDGSRILVKWYPILDKKNSGVGTYSEARQLAKALELVESKPFTDRYPYEVVGLFAYGSDDLKTLSKEFPKLAKELTNDQRQVIVSNEVDFFQDVEKTHGDKLPTQACSFGNDWDTHSATLAEDSARIKRAVEKLRTAETLATLVSLQDPDFLKGRSEARASAWMSLGLYFEHNWVANWAVTPEERTAWQRRLADHVEDYVNRLHADAAAVLGRLIRRDGKQPQFFVFNPLSWPRTDIADLPLAGEWPVHVIDLSTGTETPSQVVTRDGSGYLRILAADVPSVGYKVFEVRPGKGKEFAPAASATGGVLENDFYRLTVAERGAITSLVDKKHRQREFVVKNVHRRAVNDLGAGDGTLEVENAGPVCVTLRATSAGPLKHTSRITLVRDSRRINIRNDIEQNFNDPQTWGFGFQVSKPDVWHEEVGAVIRAKLLKDGGHYSPRNARYDWLTLNHYADVSGDGVGVTLANADCSFMRLGNSTLKELDTASPGLSVLAGGNVSGVDLRIKNQGGARHFLQRFALQTHDAFDQVEAMKFALEHQNPLVAGSVVGGTAYPEKVFSFLTISDPGVLLWALKPAEEGIDHGVIARVWNLSEKETRPALSLTQGITKAIQTTHIETDLAEVALSDGVLRAPIAGRQLVTFRLFPEAKK